MKKSDWAIALIGLLGVILGVATSAFWQWTEREERYRVMMFEKRLAVHQEAFTLTSQIRTKLLLAVSEKNMPSQDEVYSDFEEMREWWKANCLYLDSTSRKAFLDLFVSVRIYAVSYNPEDAKKCLELTKTTVQKIIQGIGEQYLPEIELID